MTINRTHLAPRPFRAACVDPELHGAFESHVMSLSESRRPSDFRIGMDGEYINSWMRANFAMFCAGRDATAKDSLVVHSAQAAPEAEPVCWVNDQQLLLCSKSPREDQPNNPMMHGLSRNIAGSALRTGYCNTPLYTAPPATGVNVPRELLRRVVGADASMGANAFQLADGWKAMDELRALLAQSQEVKS